MSKPYIVIREQPKGSNNYYKYLYTNIRKNNKHTTECIQYLGKADGPEDKSVSRADLDDDKIQEYDVDVQDIVEGNKAEESVTKDDIQENVKGKKKPSTEDFIGKEVEIEYGYPNKYIRSDPPTIQISENLTDPLKSYAHEVGHGVHRTKMTNKERERISEVHKETLKWYMSLNHMEKGRYITPREVMKDYDLATPKWETEYFAENFSVYFTPDREGYKGKDSIPDPYKEYLKEKFGEPRNMEFPKEIEQLEE